MKSDEFSDTTEIPRVPPQPTTIPKEPKEPMPAEYRAWLYGTIAGFAAFAGIVIGVSALITSSDKVSDTSKADQVEACATIEDSNAAFLCVEQVDD
jgi:hypothetical protein